MGENDKADKKEPTLKAPEKGEVCKEVPSPLTAEQLRALRHEVEQGKLPKNPEDYNYPETKLEDADTLGSILEKVFTQKGAKAPKGSIERIELALTALGLDLKKLRADSWKVEKGLLKIMNTKGKAPLEVYVINLLPWKALTEGKEKAETLSQYNYDLGVYKGAAEMTKTPDTIEGGVDATPHSLLLKQAKWIEEKVQSSALMLKIYDSNRNRFDADTQKLIADHEKILRELASQTDYNPQKFAANFEKKFAKNEVIGANGVYNLVLAFQRVLDAYGKDQSSLLSDNVKTVVTLVIGKTVRKKDERYVKAVKTTKGTGEDEGGVVCPPPEPNEKPVPPEELKPGRDRSAYERVENKPGTLTPSADQFNENLTPEVASNMLIQTYKVNGINAFMDGFYKIAQGDPDKAQESLNLVFEKLKTQDRAAAMKLMGEIVRGKAPEMKQAFDDGIKEAIDKETNPENKKVLELMKLLNDIKYDAENPPVKPAEKEEGTNEMRQILDKILSIDGTKVTGEYKEFYDTTRRSVETRMRSSMAGDILETARNGLETSLLDRTKKDTTFVNSLEELKTMSKTDLAKSLRNEGVGNWVDSDSEVYLGSSHVMEAMRLYLTYLYPQEVAKGNDIKNPIGWALDQVKNGTKISLPTGFAGAPDDYIEDALTGTKTPIAGGTIDPDSLFVAKDAELRLFDEYQKGEEKIGEMSVWNLTGSDRLSTDKEGFKAGNNSMLEGSAQLFSADLAHMMKESGKDISELGAVEQLELNKILYLRKTKNYDEARTRAATIIADKLTPPSDAELNRRALALSEKWDSKIRAQARLMIEKDPRFAGKSYEDINRAIDSATQSAIKDKAYLELIGDQAAKMDESKLNDFEKKALHTLNLINGNAGIPIADESVDVVLSVSKMVVEIALIELATWGAGTFIAGAAGVGEVAEAGATGLTVARATGTTARAYRAGEAAAGAVTLTGRSATVAARLGRMVRWTAGQTTGAGITRNVLHAGAFAEGQHLLHGSTLHPFSDPKRFAWEVGSTALTMWALGATTRFMRGQMGGLPIRGMGNTTGGVVEGMAISSGSSVRYIGGASRRIGQFLADRPYLRHPVEIGTEVVALHNLGRMEKWASVQAGMISQTEMEAMQDPVAWHEYVHTAGVVLGLRAWGVIKEQGDRQPPQLPGAKVPPQLTEGEGAPRQLPRGMETDKLNLLIRQALVVKKGEPFAADKAADLDYQLGKAADYLKQPGQDTAYALDVIRKAFNIPGAEIVTSGQIMEIRQKLLDKFPENETNAALREKIATVADEAVKALENVKADTAAMMENMKDALRKQDLKKIAENLGLITIRMEQGLVSRGEALQYIRMVFGIESGEKITKQNFYEMTRKKITDNKLDYIKLDKDAVVLDAANKLIDTSAALLGFAPAVEIPAIKPGNPEPPAAKSGNPEPPVSSPAESAVEFRIRNVRELGQNLREFKVSDKNEASRDATVKAIENVIKMVEGKKYTAQELKDVLGVIFNIPVGKTIRAESLPRLARDVLTRFHPDKNKGYEDICSPIYKTLTRLVETGKENLE